MTGRCNLATLFRYVLNLLISFGWLWAFNALGWITFHTERELWEAVAIVALITWLIQTLVGYVLAAFFVLTLGIGCLVLPVILVALGWVYLWGAATVTGLFTINAPFWWTGFLMSIAYGLVRIPDASASVSTSSSSSRS